MERYLDASVSSSALASFLNRLERTGTQAHCLEVFENGRRLIRWNVNPYRCDDKRQLYSLSKSFTSTALGAAYDRGLLKPEDKVLSFFPEYAPLCQQEEGWRRMELRHVMTMADGHAACVMPKMAFAQDGVRAFFETPLAYEPGTTFVYNTGGTCLLAEVVRRVTGMPAPQWLAQTVFEPLGIDAFTWESCADGHCEGGTGLYLSCDDVAKLGLLYLNEGQWNGRQVLSRDWVQMATGKQKDNVRNGSPDWTAGYGFQFWRNFREGYRGDGAFGQVCAVLPQRRMVVALLAESTDMPQEFEALWSFVEQMKTPGNSAVPRTAYEPEGTLHGCRMDTGWRALQENPAGLLALRVQADEAGASVDFCDANGVQRLTASSGQWRENHLYLRNFFPNLHTLMPRSQRQLLHLSAAAHAFPGGVALECRMRNAPHAFAMQATLHHGKLQLELHSPLDVFGVEKRLLEAE